jgi:hypothetical protein
MAPVGYQMTEKYDGNWQESLSEETRQMINDASFKTWQKFFDELTLTPAERRRRDRNELGKRLRLIATDMELSGQGSDAFVLMLAAAELTDHE